MSILLVEKYRTPPAIAKQLGVSPERVIAWIRSGKLRGVNLSDGRRPRYRISHDDLLVFLRGREVLSAPKPERRRRRKYRFFPD